MQSSTRTSNWKKKATAIKSVSNKRFPSSRSLIFSLQSVLPTQKNAAYYLSLQHCLLHLTLSGKRKLYVATIEGILIVFLFKIISSFIFAYENYLVHVYSHACLCTSVHISTGCVGGVGHSILGVILFRD